MHANVVCKLAGETRSGERVGIVTIPKAVALGAVASFALAARFRMPKGPTSGLLVGTVVLSYCWFGYLERTKGDPQCEGDEKLW